jgi:hypothetical protein
MKVQVEKHFGDMSPILSGKNRGDGKKVSLTTQALLCCFLMIVVQFALGR